MIRQSNGLVQSDNKLSPNTDVDQALSVNMVSLGNNEFSLVAMLVFLYSYLNDVVIHQWLVAWLTIIHVKWLVTYGVVIWILDVGTHQLSKWDLWNYGVESSWKILYSNPLLWRHNGHSSVSNHQLTIVYTTVYSDADQSKHQSSASLAFVWGIHRGPVNSPHKWPVTRKMLPFDDVIMLNLKSYSGLTHCVSVTQKTDFPERNTVKSLI